MVEPVYLLPIMIENNILKNNGCCSWGDDAAAVSGRMKIDGVAQLIWKLM